MTASKFTQAQNPQHLVPGSQADNKRDDWLHWAYGTEPDCLRALPVEEPLPTLLARKPLAPGRGH